MWIHSSIEELEYDEHQVFEAAAMVRFSVAKRVLLVIRFKSTINLKVAARLQGCYAHSC